MLHYLAGATIQIANLIAILVSMAIKNNPFTLCLRLIFVVC